MASTLFVLRNGHSEEPSSLPGLPSEGVSQEGSTLGADRAGVCDTLLFPG